jgi:hypothetical protein
MAKTNACIVLLATVLLLPMFAGRKDKVWKTGLVVDANTVKRIYPMGSTTDSRASGTATTLGNTTTATATGTANTRILYGGVRNSELLVAGEDYIYTVQDSPALSSRTILLGVPSRSRCRFVVGDNIGYAQDRGTLHVLDADGKECKMEILRQEKLPTPRANP